MGLSFSQAITQKTTITHRYVSIDKTTISSDGKFLFCKVMYDQDHFSPSYILKIDSSTNLLLDKFFLQENFVDKMEISEDNNFLAVQCRKLFYVFDLTKKEPVVLLEMHSFWFLFSGDSLFFRNSKNAFTKCHLPTLKCDAFLQFDCKTEKIRFLCVTKDLRFVFYLATLKHKSSNRIVKFDLQKNQVVFCYKSSRDIKFLFWIDSLALLVAGKYSDSLSIYKTETEVKNIKNLHFDGLLRTAVSIKDSHKVLAYYECEASSRFCVWNLDTLSLEAILDTGLERANSFFEILWADSQNIFLQKDSEILKIELQTNQENSRQEIEEEQFDFCMKKLVQILTTQKLQKMIFQNSRELKIRGINSCQDLRLSQLGEFDSLILNSVDWPQASGFSTQRKGLLAKVICNPSEIPDTDFEAKKHKLRNNKSVLKESIFSRLSTEFKENEILNCQVRKNKESLFSEPFSKINPSLRKTIIKNSNFHSEFFSASKKSGKKGKKYVPFCESDNETVKNDNSCFSLDRYLITED